MQVDEKNARSWKEYGIEFLMLFAAVTLGFFAENQRESIEINSNSDFGHKYSFFKGVVYSIYFNFVLHNFNLSFNQIKQQ